MAFLGSIGKTIGQVFSNPVVQVLFPVAAVANLTTLAAGAKLDNAISGNPAPAAAERSPYVIVPQTSYQQLPPQYVQYQTSPSGSYLQNDFAPASFDSSYGGFTPWDFSTASPTFSPGIQTVGSYPAYSMQAGRSWEDLILPAVLTFL
jgi:hypothetical protein